MAPPPADRPFGPALAALAALGLGFASPELFPPAARLAERAISLLFRVYEVVGPAILFLALSATLAAIFREAGGAHRSARFFGYLLTRKLLATAFAVAFTALALDLPLVPPGETLSGAERTKDALLRTLRHSVENPYLWATLAAVPAGILGSGLRVLGRGLPEIEELLEEVGGGLSFLGPLFLFAFGAYVRTIPERLPGGLAEAGALGAYLGGAGLVLLGCAIWHLAIVLYARLAVEGFTVAGYFSGYWIRVFPFLFATASESLSMPLNLAMTRRYYGRFWGDPGRFMVTAGSTLSVNGTVICAMVFAGYCARLAGVPVSLLDLCAAAPAVFIVSLGVPGIPGELALFADPVAAALGVPQGPALAAFRTLFLGFQVGLPDSIRTGVNSTENCLNAVLVGEERLPRPHDQTPPPG